MAGTERPVRGILVEEEHLAHGIPQLRDVQEPISTDVVPCRRYVNMSAVVKTLWRGSGRLGPLQVESVFDPLLSHRTWTP